MRIKTKANFGGVNINADGVIKLTMELPFSEMVNTVKFTLLVDKELKLKVTSEDGGESLNLEEVEFYALSMKKEGDSKVVFRTFKPATMAMDELCKFVDCAVVLEVYDAESVSE